MASARSATRRESQAAVPQPRPSRPRAAAGRGRRATGIRWDRVGRVALLLVFAFIVFLYVGPAKTYVATLKESSQRSGEVQRLSVDNQRLRARRAALRNPAVLEAEARRLGMVRPGERPYILENLPGQKPKPQR